MKPLSPLLRASITRDSNLRAASEVFSRKDRRADAASQELAEAAAAREANTARLRALRLEKERMDATAAADELAAKGASGQGPAKKKPVRRIVCS